MLTSNPVKQQRNDASMKPKLESVAEEWDELWGQSTAGSNTNAILAQSLPPALAAPTGWHSELVEESPIPSDTETNYQQNYDEYQTIRTSDAPPMIYSSNNQHGRAVEEVPIENGPYYTERVYQRPGIHEEKIFINDAQRNSRLENVVTHQTEPALVVHKKLPNNQVTYQQNVSVRYLQPPTPPPPGPIIIREVRPAPAPAPPPIQIRQRPPPPATPPPIVIRERPPPPPSREPSRVVEKLLPPPPRPPPRMIVERFASPPPKPADVVIERWLPYKRSDRKQILYERAPPPPLPPREPNLLIVHDRPRTRIEKEFINQGVVKVDPHYYLERYGPELHSESSRYHYLIDEAIRSYPPPQSLLSTRDYRSSYPFDEYDRIRSIYPDDYRRYEISTRSVSLPRFDSHYSSYYDDYHHRQASIPTMVDVTSSWGRHCYSPMSNIRHYPSSRPRAVHVRSDGELNRVLDDLTNGQRTVSFNSY